MKKMVVALLLVLAFPLWTFSETMKPENTAEEKIYEMYGKDGLKIYRGIDGSKNAEEIMREVGIDESKMQEILLWLMKKRFIKVEASWDVEEDIRSLLYFSITYKQKSDFNRALEFALMAEHELNKLKKADYNKWKELRWKANNKEELPKLHSTMLLHISGLYGGLGQFDKYLEYSEKAVVVSMELNDYMSESLAVMLAGMLNLQMGDPDKGYEYINGIFSMIERAKKAGLPEDVMKEVQAAVFMFSGFSLQFIGESEKGKSYLKSLLEIDDDPVQKANNKVEFPLLLAEVAISFEEYDRALKLVGEAEISLKELSQLIGVEKEYRLDSMKARIIALKGAIYLQTGDINAAISLLNDSIRLIDSVERALQEFEKILRGSPDYFYSYFNSIGISPSEVIRINNIIKQKMQSLRNNIFGALGEAFSKLGQYRKALEYYKKIYENTKAIEIPLIENAYVMTSTDINKSTKLSYEIEMALLYQKMGEKERASFMLNEAVNTLNSMTNRIAKDFTVLSVASFLMEWGNYELGRKLSEEALPTIKRLNYPGLTAMAERNIGRALVLQGKKEEALSYYESAINHLEGWRQRTLNLPEQIKLHFSKNMSSIYEEYVELLIDLGEHEKAYEIYEKSKARVLSEMLQRSNAVLKHDNKLLIEEKKLLEELEKIDRQLIGIMSLIDKPTGKFADKVEELLKKKTEIDSKLSVLRAKIKSALPSYYALYNTYSLKDIQKVLMPDEVLVEYYIGKDKAVVWIISRDEIKTKVLQIKEDNLQTKVKTYADIFSKETKQILIKISDLQRENITADFGRRKEIKREIEGLKAGLEATVETIKGKGNELYRLLFKPIEQMVDDKKIFIVPHGALFYLPFESLSYGSDNAKDTYLIQKYNISYLPSASVLKSLREDKKEKSDKPLIAFADPYFGSGETTEMKGSGDDTMRSLVMRSYADRGFKFRPLPDTRDEAIAVADTTKADKDRDLYLDKKAAEGEIKGLNRTADLSKYRYLLFSTHGIIGGEISFVNQPAIVLSLGIPQEDDGFLQMNEIFNLNLKADLVTLSACKTALGDDIKGEGLVGLSRAFMYAGAKALNVTLWEVESKSAKELVVGMYKYLSQGKDKAEALKQAKLDMLNGKNELYRHPFFWSPFVLIGDWK